MNNINEIFLLVLSILFIFIYIYIHIYIYMCLCVCVVCAFSCLHILITKILTVSISNTFTSFIWFLSVNISYIYKSKAIYCLQYFYAKILKNLKSYESPCVSITDFTFYAHNGRDNRIYMFLQTQEFYSTTLDKYCLYINENNPPVCKDLYIWIHELLVNLTLDRTGEFTFTWFYTAIVVAIHRN